MSVIIGMKLGCNVLIAFMIKRAFEDGLCFVCFETPRAARHAQNRPINRWSNGVYGKLVKKKNTKRKYTRINKLKTPLQHTMTVYWSDDLNVNVF